MPPLAPVMRTMDFIGCVVKLGRVTAQLRENLMLA
jgi:hypothetical protein